MAIKIQNLEQENKKLKEKIQNLEKEVNKLKRNRPASGRITKSPDEFSKSGFSKNKNRLDESSIEKNNSKESWSKLINTDLEILKELKSPPSKSPNVTKSNNDHNSLIEIEPKLILSELNTLKEENKYLKMQLRKKNFKMPRSESRVSKKNDSDLNDTYKNSRTKHCKVCVKLLSKGYTTRFCPTHGHSFKSLNKSYLT